MASKRGRPKAFNAREVGKLAYLLENVKEWLENESKVFNDQTKKAKRIFLLTMRNALKNQIELHVAENLRDYSVFEVISKSLDYVFNKNNKSICQETHDGYNDFAVSKIIFETSELKSPAGVKKESLCEWFEENYNAGEKLGVITDRRNILKGNYAQSDANAVWCSDTTIRDGLYLTLIIDTASRYVVGSFVDNKAPTGGDMILFLGRCISEFGVKPKVFHSDQGSYYTSDNFAGFLKESNIEQSLDVRHKETPGNQVLEGFNNKLWSFLKASKTDGPGLKEFASRTFKSNTYLIEAALNYFNDKKDLGGRNYTPRALYEALSELNVELGLEAKSTEAGSLTIKKFHNYAVQKREVEEMFKDATFRAQTGAAQIREVLNALKLNRNETLTVIDKKLDQLLNFCSAAIQVFNILVHNQKTIMDKQELQLDEELKTRLLLQKSLEEKTQQNALLNENLVRTIEELALARAEREREKREREERRQRRKLAEQKPLRAPLEKGEITAVLSAVKGETPVLEARDRIAILLMFTFGLRISNVMKISMGQLKALKHGREVEIKQLKDRTNKPFRLVASTTVLQWFEAYHEDFRVFFAGSNKPDDSPFILLSREHLNRRLNAYFKEVSVSSKKYIRSHSARITLGTNVVATCGLAAAKNILGHKSIASTMFYDRNNLTPTEQKKIYDSVLPEAPASKPRAGRKQAALLVTAEVLEEKREGSSVKKRGRPPKVCFSVEKAKEEAPQEVSVSAPFKKQGEQGVVLSLGAEPKDKTTQVIGEVQPPKKRGRPPKVRVLGAKTKEESGPKISVFGDFKKQAANSGQKLLVYL